MKIVRTRHCGVTLVVRDPMQQAVRDALIAFMAATARGCDGFLRYQNRLDLGQRDIGLLRRR